MPTTKFDLYSSDLMSKPIDISWDDLSGDWASYEAITMELPSGNIDLTKATDFDDLPMRLVVEACIEAGVMPRDYWDGGWDNEPLANELYDYMSRYSSTGPQMDYVYPLTDFGLRFGKSENGLWSAAALIADYPLCVVEIEELDVIGLALTGGGMDLSWEICGAYIALGFYPPVHFAGDLPRMAGYHRERHVHIAEVCLEACEIAARWAENHVEDARRMVAWAKGLED